MLVGRYEMASESALKEALHAIALEKGFKEGKYHITLREEKEFLHLGAIKKYQIKCPTGRELNLLVRQKSCSPDKYFPFPMDNCFFNNVHYYTNVHPIIQHYGAVPTVPKFYGCSLEPSNEYIILEDLESNGFVQVPIAKGLSEAQLKLVINCLTNFHATIVGWESKNSTEFKSICSKFEPFIGRNYPYSEEKLHDYEQLMKKILIAAWLQSRRQCGNSLQKVIRNLIEGLPKDFMKAIEEKGNESWETLVNFFIWTPNLLFRNHSITGAPLDVAIVDWSATRLGSPVHDLSLLILASADTLLYQNIEKLLEIYNNVHLSKDDLMHHFKIYGLFGVYGALLVNMISAFEQNISSDQLTTDMMSDENLTSDVIPDIKYRIIEIIKAANRIGIV